MEKIPQRRQTRQQGNPRATQPGGDGESGVSLSPTGVWGYLEKEISECGGTQHWVLFVILMMLISFTDC